MRPEVLPLLACPSCDAALGIQAEPPEPDGHILAGELTCPACRLRFPIRDGVPVLLSEKVEAVKLETASRFADEWLHWSDLRDYYQQEFFAWLAPLTPEDFAGKTVFEGGCGKGRHSALIASLGAKNVVSVDLGESAFVAFAHTRHLPNAHVIIGDLLRPPMRPVFDLAFSVGVLHHLPDPAAGFASLASRVRQGGRVAFWVYGYEGNEWITKFVDPVRKGVTSHLPAGLLRAACVPPSLFLWGAIKLFYRPRPDGRGPARLPYGDYFASMYDYPFDEIHANVFDQMVTPVAYYLKGDEVRSWLKSGFRDVVVRWHRGYSWTGVATVDRRATTSAAGIPPAVHSCHPERGL